MQRFDGDGGQSGCTHTTEKLRGNVVKDGKICLGNSGCLLAMVVERMGRTEISAMDFLQAPA